MPVTFSRDARSKIRIGARNGAQRLSVCGLVCGGSCHPVAIILNCGLSVNKMVLPFGHSGCGAEIVIYAKYLT